MKKMHRVAKIWRKWMMEPGYGKCFQSAFCVFSLQYDMIDNLTLPYLTFLLMTFFDQQ